jgi:hypothetical protein
MHTKAISLCYFSGMKAVVLLILSALFIAGSMAHACGFLAMRGALKIARWFREEEAEEIQF